jgi:heme/copper-type cytochrome/quinol oxidase subunit 2
MPDHQDTPSVGAHATRGPARDAISAQHDRFGGFKWGAGFFGWLSATGLAVLLIAAISAAGVTIGLTNSDSAGQAADAATDAASTDASTIGLVGGIVLLVVLLIAYFAGGYVAGRMARFDGVKQGIAVWVVGLLIIALLALATVVLGSQYNLLAQLNLPRIPVDEGTLTTGGIIALAAVLLVTLLGAILGGITGTRYHRKIDRVGVEAVSGR